MTFLTGAKLTSAAIALSLISCTAIAPTTETKIAQSINSQSTIQFTPPTPPDPGNPSDRGQGGGRRGPCDEKYPNLTALVPAPRPNQPDDRWGLTISNRPTIWFSTPTGIEDGTLIEWRLRDANGKTLQRTTSRLSKTASGTISFPVPAPLAIATYQWDLAVYCHSSNSENDVDQPLIRKGRIQRIAPPKGLEQELSIAKTPLERAKIYAKYGIWYDALNTLGTELRSKDKAISNAWRELLQQQKLSS